MTVATPQGSHTLTFTGGLYTKPAEGGQTDEGFSSESANVRNKFDDTGKTQTFDIGSYTFTVELQAYTPPGPPSHASADHDVAGSISAHVTVTTLSPGQIDSPEPGTLVLSCLGLSFAGGAAWRKRRQAPLAQAQ